MHEEYCNSNELFFRKNEEIENKKQIYNFQVLFSR